jgi:hypothetical protein
MSDTGIPQNPENQKAPLILAKRSNSGQLVPYGNKSGRNRQKIKIRVVKVPKNTTKNVQGKSKSKVVPKVRRIIVYPESVTPVTEESAEKNPKHQETGLVPYKKKSARNRQKTRVRVVKTTKNTSKKTKDKSKTKTELIPYNKKDQQQVVSKGLSKQTSPSRVRSVGPTKPSSDTDSIYDVPPEDWWYTPRLPGGDDDGNGGGNNNNTNPSNNQGRNKRGRWGIRLPTLALSTDPHNDRPHLHLSNRAPRRRPNLPAHIDRRHYGKSNILRINEV